MGRKSKKAAPEKERRITRSTSSSKPESSELDIEMERKSKESAPERERRSTRSRGVNESTCERESESGRVSDREGASNEATSSKSRLRRT